MNFLEVIELFVLGIVQGIAEFLPISSSAHLIIFRDIFKVGSFLNEEIALSFDVALHLGTLLAIGIYFFKDFIKMFKTGFTKGVKDREGKLLWYIVIATIPGALFGFLFEDIIEVEIRKNFYLIAVSLSLMGIILYLCDHFRGQQKTIGTMSIKDAIFVGICQTFALIPGFSRSGTTIAASRYLKMNREDAAKFSFYLSAPITLGAVVLYLLNGNMFTLISAYPLAFVLGVSVSFITGMLCINFLLKYLRKNDFKIFMWYRLIISLIVLVVLYFK